VRKLKTYLTVGLVRNVRNALKAREIVYMQIVMFTDSRVNDRFGRSSHIFYSVVSF